jgi:hypothetical protein
MQENDKCPCCRAALVESKAEHEEEDDDDDDYAEDDDDDDSTMMTGFEDDDDMRLDVDLVISAFVEKGYDVKDCMSLLLCRYSKTDPKYTKTYIETLNDDFDEIVEEVKTRAEEQNEFEKEDRDAGKIEDPNCGLSILASVASNPDLQI